MYIDNYYFLFTYTNNSHILSALCYTVIVSGFYVRHDVVIALLHYGLFTFCTLYQIINQSLAY